MTSQQADPDTDLTATSQLCHTQTLPLWAIAVLDREGSCGVLRQAHAQRRDRRAPMGHAMALPAHKDRVSAPAHTRCTHAQQQVEAPRDVQRVPSSAAGCLLASRAHRPDLHRVRQIYQNPFLDSPLTGGAFEDRRLRCAPFAACILLPRNQERARVAILAPAACALHFAVTQLPPKERGTRPHALAPSPVVVVLRQQLPDLVSIRLAWSLVPHLTFHSLRASVLLLFAAVLIARHYASF